MSAPRAGGKFPFWIVPAGVLLGALLMAWALRLTPRRADADEGP